LLLAKINEGMLTTTSLIFRW